MSEVATVPYEYSDDGLLLSRPLLPQDLGRRASPTRLPVARLRLSGGLLSTDGGDVGSSFAAWPSLALGACSLSIHLSLLALGSWSVHSGLAMRRSPNSPLRNFDCTHRLRLSSPLPLDFFLGFLPLGQR